MAGQTKWEVGQHPAISSGWIVKPVLFGANVRVLPDSEGGHVVIRDEKVARLIASAPELLEALQGLLGVIDAAGLINLSNGVQLGQTVWFVKASDAVNYATAAIAKATQP